ncbi:MAG: RnfABCDGE type electron transport complex subunit D [Clostridiales bacterium]|nr:RnfABCDGE type electron transport complex subunit D [Clostridiales bacterium]
MKLQVSNSPHIRDKATTASIMRDVVIALIPACVASGIIFGLRAVVLILVSVLSCVVFEYLSRKVMKRENTVPDFSAVVTGVLLGLNLPPTLPIYMVVIGSLFAIVVVKQMFGGLGNNFVNPALAARIFLVISFPSQMTRWTVREGAFSFFDSLLGKDLISSATPLAIMRNAVADSASGATSSATTVAESGPLPSLLSLFLGEKGGCIGEVCILALLIGAAYLFIRKVIVPWIPLAYLGSFTILVLLFGHTPLFEAVRYDPLSLDVWADALYEPTFMLLTGGLIIGAFFMATDYVTSPITTSGRLLFGLGCGILTFLIRYYGNMAEGVSFSIILMNILTPHIDRLTMSKPFGERRAKKNATT